MGLLDRLGGSKPEEPWRPPLPGLCSCVSHVETLGDLKIDATPPTTVAEFVARDAVSIVASAEHFLYGATTGERRGPYQWRLTYTADVSHLYDADAPASLDDMLFIQEGIQNILRLDDTTLAIGAESLCERGIEAAFVTALANPRVRRA